MAGGVVLAFSWLVAIPVELVLLAGVVWVTGIVALGVLSYREGRRNGLGSRRSLAHAFRRFARGVWELLF